MGTFELKKDTHKDSSRLVFLVIVLVCLSATFLAEAVGYENNLVRYIFRQKNKIPRRGYNQPSEGQIELLRQAAHFIKNNQFAGATRCANAVGYSLKSFIHTNGLTYYVLVSLDPKRRSWGTYVFYLGDDKTNFAMEIPHPVTEVNTSVIGIKAFIDSQASFFLLSGSRRGAGPGSDVTLNPDSVFEAIHEEVTTSESPPISIQIHGFNNRRYPEIVLTSGSPVVISAMDQLVARLLDENFTVGIYDGVQYDHCGATQNVQAIYTNSIGNDFIGIFLNRIVHNSYNMSNLVVEAIKEYTLDETSGGETST